MFYIYILLHSFKYTTCARVRSGLLQMGKNTGRIYFSSKTILIHKQTENTSMTKPSNFLHHKLHITFIHTHILKQKLLSSRTWYGAWTTTAMGGCSSLPIPGERSNSDFSGPLSLLWSPWLELGGAINKVLVLRLNTNSAHNSKISQL